MEERLIFKDLLQSVCHPWFSVPEALADRLYRHYEVLVCWNRKVNLTSVRGLVETIQKHYAESLFLGVHLPGEAKRIADIGSGAGFPGFPTALCRPEAQVDLVERVGKKVAFLRESAIAPNVRIIQAGSSELTGEYDWLISRAVRMEEVLGAARRLHTRVAVLISAADSLRFPEFRTISLPWSGRGVVAYTEAPVE
jgi:Predicted S-adenosylmethionine-dependent methyltransferase involved in bacterial cell division